MTRTRARALFGALETGGYGQDPSADGSGYNWFPVDVMPELLDKKDLLETKYFTGRNWDTPMEEGPDGWGLDGCETPLIGLSAAVADGVDASTIADDWQDDILSHIYGVQETTVTETVTAVGSATNITLATDLHDIHDVFPLYESGVPSLERLQWNVITADNGAGDYDVAPGFADFGTAPPTTAAIAYALKRYIWDLNGGDTMAFVYRDHTQDYTLLGGRCTSAQIRIPTGGGRVKLVTSWRGDTKTESSKASLPVPGVAPANACIRGVRSPIWFNGTRYDTSEIIIDLGVGAVEIPSTSGSEGRGGDEHVSNGPMITFRPRFSTAIENLKRNATQGRLLVQIGSGRLANGALNGQAIHADNAQAQVVTRTDDNGVKRQEVQMHVSDPGVVGGALTNIWQHLRC